MRSVCTIHLSIDRFAVMQVLSDFCRVGAGSIRVLGTYLAFSKGVLVTARLVYMSQLPIVVYLISSCRESCRNHSDIVIVVVVNFLINRQRRRGLTIDKS